MLTFNPDFSNMDTLNHNREVNEMTSPIILGVVAEVLAALPLERVVAMSVGLADAIIEEDDEIDDDRQLFMTSVGELREIGPEWVGNPFLICNIVASLLESETMRIANPILAAYPNADEEDRSLIIRCTDDLQVEAMALVAEQLAAKYLKPEAPVVLRRGSNDVDGQWNDFASRY